MKQPFYKDGLRFECQGSGKCCVSRGQWGFVYLDTDDEKKLAKELKLTVAKFKKTFCELTDGFVHLRENPDSDNCIFLKNNRCSVYEGRPTQCRTWPFWPEVMNAKAWKKEVVQFCPGANKGKLHSAKDIEKVLKEQSLSETKMNQRSGVNS